MEKPLLRVILFILVFFIVALFPWWLSIPVLLFFTIYFPLYLEVLFFAFLLDNLYAVDYAFPYFGLTIATALLLISIFVKTQIRR